MNETTHRRKIEVDDGNAWPCTRSFMTSEESSTPSLDGAVVLPGVAASAMFSAMFDRGLSVIVSSWLTSSPSNGCCGT